MTVYCSNSVHINVRRTTSCFLVITKEEEKGFDSEGVSAGLVGDHMMVELHYSPYSMHI